jgi:hypothetical protein
LQARGREIPSNFVLLVSFCEPNFGVRAERTQAAIRKLWRRAADFYARLIAVLPPRAKIEKRLPRAATDVAKAKDERATARGLEVGYVQIMHKQ